MASKALVMPKPIYLADIQQADSEHELFAYVSLMARRYRVSISPELSYLDMAMEVKKQLDAPDVISDPSRISDLYCAFMALSEAHNRELAMGMRTHEF